MSWDTSTEDLRALISDGETDKYNFRKAVFGNIDGSNQTFKTFDGRRVTDFTDAEAPLGVYVAGEKVSVTEDFPESGEFTLGGAPDAGTKVEASYYIQWFLDTELAAFLRAASQWCLSISDVTAIPPGLQPSVLHFAAAECYQKLSIKLARLVSAEYRVEDAASKELLEMVKTYADAAKSERETAETVRSQYYDGRNDQSKAPLFVSIQGAVPIVQPKR